MRFLFYILLLLNISFQDEKNVYADENITIPPPILLDDSWFPSVNQFILMPAEGHVLVYYLGVFNPDGLTPDDQKTRNLILPLPKNATHIQNFNQENELENLQKIQLSFMLDAPFGEVEWKPDKLQTLPGVTILMMNDPVAKIVMLSGNFVRDFKKGLSSGQQFVRASWNLDTPYPEFKITGIIPSRMWIYIVVGLVGCVLFFSLFLLYRHAPPLSLPSAKC